MRKYAAAWSIVLSILAIASPQLGAVPAQQEELSGQLHLIWADKPGLQDSEENIRYVLTTGEGEWVELQLDEAQARPFGGVLALNKKQIHLRGRWLNASADKPRFAADSIQTVFQSRDIPLLEEGASAVTGSKKWANLLCRFGDSTGVTPKPSNYFDGMMGSVYPGLDHYWQEISFNNVNLQGATTAGWYNLPRERSYYIYDSDADGSDEANLDRLLKDCTAAADPDLYFPDYSGINMMFNDNLDSYAWGGNNTLSRDGQTKLYSVTWMPPWGYKNQCVLAHEMGHGFGLPHSSGPYAATYDSPWDVMSDNWASSLSDSQYGCVGVHTISYHKDMLGWIPSARKLVVNAGMRRRIDLDRLALPASQTGYLMAQIPIGGSTTRFYTVEARSYAGYDEGLPGEAIVIHSVDTTRARQAQVVDADSNGDPEDDGSMWLPGEKFVDAENAISVAVNAAGASGFTVTINSGAVDEPALTDFNGDGVSDLAVWRPGTGVWYASPGAPTGTTWGVSSDTPVAADYDGDGKTDIAVWRPGNGIWYIRPSTSPGTYTARQWGASSDHPLPADYDGDGVVDIAVWRPGTGIWFVLPTNSPNTYTGTKWGVAGDIAVPADYDGDGKSDIAVWRPTAGIWYILQSKLPGTYKASKWGLSDDIPVPCDYDGDGKSDMAVWRAGTGTWYMLRSATPGSYLSTRWGMQTDIPAPGDYDGDGTTDIAVWRPGTGVWYILPSSSPGSYRAIEWGKESDRPVSQIANILDIMP